MRRSGESNSYVTSSFSTETFENPPPSSSAVTAAGVGRDRGPGVPGGGGDKPAHEQLSEREFQVFLRLAKGETIGHMANSMSLSVKTVSTYRTRVMEKMKLESNSDLTYYALKNGLIQ